MTIDFRNHNFGKDMNENINFTDGKYILLNIKTKECVNLGFTVEEARKTLRDLGKIDNFPDF